MTTLGTSITFVNQQTVVPANWLQDVNNTIYNNTGPIQFSTNASNSAFNATTTYPSGSTGLALQARGISVTDAPYNADPTGVADSTAAINNAVAAVSAVGGGTVVIPPGTYKQTGTITLLSNVILQGYGATLNYSGSGIQIDTATTGYLGRAGLFGLTLNYGTACTVALRLYSAYQCAFRDIQFQGTSTTTSCLYLGCNSTGATPYGGSYNSVFNTFDNIVLAGTAGTFVILDGVGPAASPVAISTDNSFNNIQTGGNGEVYVYGIEFRKWCDSNTFSGMTRIALASVTNASSVGVVFNTAGPTQNFGVYSETFEHLAIDCFGTPTGDTRVGIKLNFCATITIPVYECLPIPAGGTLVQNSNVYSYQINRQLYNSTNYTAHNWYGAYLGIGGGINPSYSLNLTQFGIASGTTQGSVNLTDTFVGATSAVNVISSVPQLAGATNTGTLAHHAIGNTNLSGGATLTYQIGVDIGPLAAATNNWGIHSTIPAGSGNLFLNHAGTAYSVLGGPLGINGQFPVAQQTGWGTPTGTGPVANFPGATATLAQCSQAIATLIADLKAFGLLGA